MSSANPYLQGMAAAEEDKAASANPFRKGRTEWRQWQSGFQAARAREGRKKRQRAGSASAGASGERERRDAG